MGDSRFTSIGWGKYANFSSRTDNLFAQGDTTPDVTNGVLFFTNNTTNTAITNFDLSTVGPINGQSKGTFWQEFEGKEIKVFLLDDSTRLVNGGRLVLQGSNGLQGPNNFISLIYHNSSWIETGRSYNQSNVITFSSAAWLTATGNPVMNASTGNINVTGRGSNIVIKHLAEAASNIALRRAVGGEEGSHLTIVAVGGSHSLVIVNSDATDTFICTSSASSTQFRLVSSGAVSFIYNNRRWHEITPVVVGTGGISGGV